SPAVRRSNPADMTLSPQRLKAIAAVLVGLAIVELVSTVHVIVFGPFAAHVGPLRISGQDATKLFNIGVLAACAAVWLFEQATPDATTSSTSRVLRWVALAAVVASGVSLAAPELLPAFPLGHDAGVHPTHAFLFHRALAEGQIPVRWVEWIQDGLGQPLFSYYQVGFYYAVELIHAFGPSLELSIKLAVVA